MVNRSVRFDAKQSDVSEQSAMSEERKFAAFLLPDESVTNFTVYTQ